MIQRIQSIFLILAAGTFGSLFMLPLATSDQPSARFLSDSVYDITDHPVLLILTILGILVSLAALFMFRNRRLQAKLGYMVIVVAILLPVVAFLLFTNQASTMDSAVQVYDQAGMFLPLGSILFGALANYYIRKDDRLVQSMDRLR